MLIKLKNFILKNRTAIILGVGLGLFFSFSGIVIAPGLNVKILPYLTEADIQYEILTDDSYYGISGLPFPSKAGCNYTSIQHGIFLNPSCDGTSIFGMYALLLNILFWILISFLMCKTFSFVTSKRKYAFLPFLTIGLVFFILLLEFKTFIFRD